MARPAPDGPLGFTRLRASKPTIAAISGWALAGGLELALWCDLRVATSDSNLGFTERRFGVPLIDGGTQRLPRIVGMGRALEMILTGRLVDAPTALEWGLVTEVVEPGRHLDRALEIAAGLAAFPQETMLSDRRAALEGIGAGLRGRARARGEARPRFDHDRGGGGGALRRRRGPRRRGRRRLASTRAYAARNCAGTRTCARPRAPSRQLTPVCVPQRRLGV